MSVPIAPETEALLLAESRRLGIATGDLLARAVRSHLIAGGSDEESSLIRDVTEALPESFWDRFRQLASARQLDALTEAERGEMIAMVRLADEWRNRRLEAAIRLARRRGVSLDHVRTQYAILAVSLELQ